MSLKGYKPQGFEAVVGKALADYGRVLRHDSDASMAPYFVAIRKDFPDVDMRNVGLMFTGMLLARRQRDAR